MKLSFICYHLQIIAALHKFDIVTTLTEEYELVHIIHRNRYKYMN
jgi:hypothetical protein